MSGKERAEAVGRSVHVREDREVATRGDGSAWRSMKALFVLMRRGTSGAGVLKVPGKTEVIRRESPEDIGGDSVSCGLRSE